MQYIFLIIVKVDFNDRYGNNSTGIDFIIQDTVINYIIEGSDWSICANFILIQKPLISSAALLNRYSDINIFKERERVKFSSNRKFIILLEEGGKTLNQTSNLVSYFIYDSVMKNKHIIILRFSPNVL